MCYLRLALYLYGAFMSSFLVVALILERCSVVRVTLIVAWYDCWMGFYVDRSNHRIYVFWLPMFGMKVERWVS